MIDAVRVPPSAWITSQSIAIVTSGSLRRLTADLSERPIRRWISDERPDGRPRDTSLVERVSVARGSIAYSAVSQPRPLPTRKGGTRRSTLAEQSTRVSPNATSAEPSAYFIASSSIDTGLRAEADRPPLRAKPPDRPGLVTVVLPPQVASRPGSRRSTRGRRVRRESAPRVSQSGNPRRWRRVSHSTPVAHFHPAIRPE